MKSNLALTLITTLFLSFFISCAPEPANEDSEKAPPTTKLAAIKKIDENTIIGKYNVRLDAETLKMLTGKAESEGDELGMAFAAGFLSMLKIEAEFTEAGNINIGGGIGALGFPPEKIKGVTYKVKGKNLTVYPPEDSDEEKQTLTIESTAAGMVLELDSVKIVLDRK